jgi:ubiquinone/menaquinone biosynthesis C-methylase UbiE
MRKEKFWQDPSMAAEYDQRRFGTPLKRWKQQRDERLVWELLFEGLGRAGISAQGASLLDMPCGTGRLMPAYAQAGLCVLGVDVSLPMMAEKPWDAAPPGILGLVQGSALGLPLGAGCVDASLCMRFLFHLDDASERIAVLSELARVTRGPVLGQVRYRWTLKHFGRYLRSRLGLSKKYAPSHSRADVEAELRAAGLQLERMLPMSRLFSDKALFVACRR